MKWLSCVFLALLLLLPIAAAQAAAPEQKSELVAGLEFLLEKWSNNWLPVMLVGGILIVLDRTRKKGEDGQRVGPYGAIGTFLFVFSLVYMLRSFS